MSDDTWVRLRNGDQIQHSAEKCSEMLIHDHDCGQMQPQCFTAAALLRQAKRGKAVT